VEWPNKEIVTEFGAVRLDRVSRPIVWKQTLEHIQRQAEHALRGQASEDKDLLRQLEAFTTTVSGHKLDECADILGNFDWVHAEAWGPNDYADLGPVLQNVADMCYNDQYQY